MQMTQMMQAHMDALKRREKTKAKPAAKKA